jgi:hypothetical protein
MRLALLRSAYLHHKEMTMARQLLRSVLLFLVVVMSAISACAAPSTPSKPSVVIISPQSNSQFNEGDEVTIQSVSNDADGIDRVELVVDGQVARADIPPSPQTSFTISQTWTATSGSHTIVVRAVNKAGLSSDPATLQVSILSANAPVSAPTLSGGMPPPAPPGNPPAPPMNPGGSSGGANPNPTNTPRPQASATPSTTGNSGGAPTATPTFFRVITLPPLTLIIRATNTPTSTPTRLRLPTPIRQGTIQP